MRVASRPHILILVLLLAACQATPPATPTAPALPPPSPIAAATATQAPTAAAAASPSAPASALSPTAPITPTGAAFGQSPLYDIWTPGGKLGVGTAYTYDAGGKDRPAPSRVWFQITGGAITDLLWPTLGQDQVRELSLVVAGPGGVRRELDTRSPLTPTVQYMDPQALAYRVLTADPDGTWQASKEIVTDPAGDSLVTRWTFTTTEATRSAYVYFGPRLGSTGRNNQLAVRDDGSIVAWNETAQVYAVLLSDPAPHKESVGYLRASDGLTDLADDRMDWTFDRLPKPGYGAATLALPANQPVTLVIGFGETEAAARAAAQSSLQRGFTAVARDYIAGWRQYTSRLKPPAQPDPLYWVSALVLKAHEDKTYRGAGVASLSMPWGNCRTDEKANEQGYRYVWPRDLYHVAMAFIALGDLDSARATLAYLDDVMQTSTGAFPQNATLDGKAHWASLQMDEIADPILLAWQLDARDRYQSLVKPAADFMVGRGPTTTQDRWEEIGGYVPHSLAAQIAGLIAAADMAERAGDAASAGTWRAKADEWAGQIEKWTFTTSGPLGNGRYFLRAVPSGQPNAAEDLTIANGGGRRPQQEVVDVSVLELVRLGVRSAAAPSILDSLPELDAAAGAQTAPGLAWHRYTFDAYGEPARNRCPNGKGHLWPLFTGERGHYDVAAGQIDQARARLATMRGFANAGLMLPEQVWEDTAGGTGSATPLAWAHAEYILLARSIADGKVFDMPSVVAARYASGK